MTEVTSTECNEIINNINKMADTSIEAIKIDPNFVRSYIL